MLGASSFEGALATDAVYDAGPVGAVIGGLAGIVLAVRMGLPSGTAVTVEPTL